MFKKNMSETTASIGEQKSKSPVFSFEEIAFFIKVILVYGCWKMIHMYMQSTPELQWQWIDHLRGLSVSYAYYTSVIMNWFGYQSYNTGIWIQIDPIHYMWVAEHCLALPAMFVFAFSLLLFKGEMRDKLWFIPLGLIGIFAINLFRLVSLGFLRAHLDEMSYQVFHKFVFLGITYGLILLMVIWWMNRTMRKVGSE